MKRRNTYLNRKKHVSIYIYHELTVQLQRLKEKSNFRTYSPKIWSNTVDEVEKAVPDGRKLKGEVCMHVLLYDGV